RAALAIAPDMLEAGDARLPGGQQLLHGEFGRGMQIHGLPRPVIADHFGGEGMQMRLIAGRTLQARRIDHEEIALGQPVAHRRIDARTGEQERAPIGVALGMPPGRSRHCTGLGHAGFLPSGLAKSRGIGYRALDTGHIGAGLALPLDRATETNKEELWSRSSPRPCAKAMSSSRTAICM